MASNGVRPATDAREEGLALPRGDSLVPPGVIGATSGALAALVLLPFARRLGSALAAAPSMLPGAEAAAGDLKAASYGELALVALGVPVAATVLGRSWPRLLARRCGGDARALEWPALALTLALPLWRHGLRPRHALLVAMALWLGLTAVAVASTRARRWRRRLRRLRRGEPARLALVVAAGALVRRIAGAPWLGDVVLEVAASAALVVAVALVAALRVDARRWRRWRAGARVAAPAALLLAASASLLPGAASSALAIAAIALAIAGPPLLSALGQRPLPRLLSLRVATPVWLVVVLAVVCFRPEAPVELFEDGHALANAGVYLAGGAPFRDTYPVHGWGADGGLDALLFRVTGPSLAVFRARRSVMMGAAFGALALVCDAAFVTTGASVLGFVLALGICPILCDRHCLALAATALLAAAARRDERRLPLAFAAGVVIGLELCFSVDFGLFVLAGGGAGLGLAKLAGERDALRARLRAGARALSTLVAGVALGLAPVVLAAAAGGALRDVVRVSLVEIPREIVPTFGLPMPAVTRTLLAARGANGLVSWLDGGNGCLLLAALLAVVVALLLARAGAGALAPDDRAACVTVGVALLALRGVAGRADGGHLAAFGIFAALPLAWALQRLARAVRAREGAALALALLLAAGYALRWHPIEAIEGDLAGIAAARRGTVGETVPDLRRLLDALALRLAPGATFFDFTNEPALYFLAGRIMPVRFLAVPFYETVAKQREVIAALERRRPPLALLACGNVLDAIDGIPNAARAPLVAAYLDHRYARRVRVGRFVLGLREEVAAREAPPRDMRRAQ